MECDSSISLRSNVLRLHYYSHINPDSGVKGCNPFGEGENSETGKRGSSSCRGESSSSRYRGGGSLPEAKLKLENATRKLNRAEHDRASARISRTNAREEVGPRLRAFKSTPPITVLEDCDLMAITLMGYGPHSLLKFRLGVSARDQTTLNRLARFMGLNPEDGLQELTADRTFRLLPNSDTIELVPER